MSKGTVIVTVGWLVILVLYIYYALIGSFRLLLHASTAGSIVGYAIVFILAIIGFIFIAGLGLTLLFALYSDM